MVSCGAGIIKILLGIFNLIWLVLGGAVVFIGVKLVKWDKDFNGAASLADINLKNTSYAILAIGIVIALISFLGFFGACCENSFMLNSYGFLMILMVGAQVYAIVYSIKNGSIESKIQDSITKAIQEVSKDKETAYLLGELQYNLKCCGFNGPQDYGFTNGTASLPASCCGVKPEKVDPYPKCGPSGQVVNKDGCKNKLYLDELEKYFKGSTAVGIAIILFELILVFAACCLAREVRYN